jgi:hypothetical protein
MTTSLQRGMVTPSADSACLYGTHKYYKTRTRFLQRFTCKFMV